MELTNREKYCYGIGGFGKDLVYALFDHEYYIKTLNKPLIEKLGNLEVKDERKNKRK